MTNETVQTAEPSANDKIVCHIDNVRVHAVQSHIAKNHADTWTVQRYRDEFPDAPLLSPYAEMLLERKRKEREATAAAQTPAAQAAAPAEQTSAALTANLSVTHSTLHEVFELGNATAAMSATGNPIRIDVLSGHNREALDYLPAIDDGYVFNIDLLKKVIIGFQLNMPTYLWGYHGTGKTTVLQQAAARTKRPFMRVQHSLNMQESEVLGQWIVKDGATQFQLGPLPMAMIYGWVYCADEYDTAMPNVTTLYQPVLEGQPLIIKDAPPMFRKIVPHANFRFVATGNTNGIGDETGLYQGTLMQNAANYSRFKITEEVKYMDKEIETSILMSRTGLRKQEAAKIVKFGNKVRDAFSEGKISSTISPREMISAAELGIAFGSKWATGLKLAFANRLSRVDQKVIEEYMQREFGTVE